MPYTLPELPYPNNALEPHIDAKTMEIHHDKHHAAYVTNLNKALEGAGVAEQSIEDLCRNIETVPANIRSAVRNNGGGHANHSLFWTIMSPKGGGAPTGELAKAIDAELGGFDKAKADLIQAGVTRFGSGWAWLSVDKGGKLVDLEHAEPGQPLDGRQDADPRHRRLGARLLSQVPEPPPRLPRRDLEHVRLERDQRAVQESRPEIEQPQLPQNI